MTTSWLGQFLPQTSIYNRILPKAAKGGGENTSWWLCKSMCTLSKPVSKEPLTGGPAKASETPLGAGRGGSPCSLFPSPTENQFSFQLNKGLQNQDVTTFKTVREDT